MTAQTVSWNHLESLLDEVAIRKPVVTPKNKLTKTDDGTHPHLLRCMRYKKNKRAIHQSIQPIKHRDTFTSHRDKITVNAFATPMKSCNDIIQTQATAPDYQRTSLQNLNDISDISDEVKDFFADEHGDGQEVTKPRRFGSVQGFEQGPAAGSQEIQKPLAGSRQACLQDTLRVKRFRPICGIEYSQVKELYKLKCQDLKVSSFVDSEDNFVLGLRKKSYGNKLCIYESGFGPKALEKLGQILQNNSEVVHLCIRKSALTGPAVRSFARNLAKMPCLVHIELANNSIEPQDFSVLFDELSNSKTLISIDLSNYEPDRKNRFSLECADAFQRFVNGNETLQFVKMINMMLEDEVVEKLLTGLEGSPNLLSLNLSSNNFSGKCLENLPNLFANTALHQIDLSNNKLKKEGTVHIARVIQGYKDANREGLDLILENTQLGADVNTIFTAFARETNVAKLNISHNQFFDVEMLRFEAPLSENARLLELNMSHCKIGEIGGALLAQGLQKNNTLQNLILLNNEIGDPVGAQVIYALERNHSLKIIDVSQNKLASESAKALQELMKKNPNVERYNLSMNKFDENEGYLLQEALYFSSRITLFNLHHNPVKYNTIETVERIVKDNIRKLNFQALPKLKDEVARRRDFIEDERHAIVETVELEKMKVEINRDVDKFQRAYDMLKNRPESPSIKKNEKMIVRLGKELREQNRQCTETIQKYRAFNDEAFIEKESYKNELENASIQLGQSIKKVEAKKRDIEEVQDKYEPEIKKLRQEISKLKEDNHFIELYNDTIQRKIRKEKKKAVIQTRLNNPKISDMFLATSELARHKRKNELADKTNLDSKSRIIGLESNSHFSHISDDSRIAKEYSFALKNQQSRINRLMKDSDKKDPKLRKKKHGKGENGGQDDIKSRIKAKIRGLLKENDNPQGLILGQITDNY